MFELKKSRQWWSLLPVMVATVFGSFVVDEAQAKDRAIGFYTRGDVAQAPGSRNGFDNPNVADPTKPANWAEDVDGIVVQVEWAYLQPTRPADPDNTANLQLETGVIDSAIAEVKNWNRSHTNKLGIKLRVFAGIYTPQWVKDDVGSTTLDFEDSDFDGSYPHYWTQEYRTRYAQLHHALATKYDSVGVIKEVAISGCMIKNADMNRSPNEWQNINRLIDDGLTWQKDKGCQQWQIDTVASKWDRTKVAVARPHFRKFVKVTSQPSDTEWPISKTIMQEMVDTCRAHGNCIIGENSLERWDMEHNAFTDPFHPIYYVCGKYLENYEPKAPVYFQTGAFVDDNGTLTYQVLYWAIQNCGNSILKMIELPQLKKFNQYDVKYANDNNVPKTSYLGSDKMQSKRDKLKQ